MATGEQGAQRGEAAGDHDPVGDHVPAEGWTVGEADGETAEDQRDDQP
jgi:hypothetical protein